MQTKTLTQVIDKFPKTIRDRFDFTNAIYKGALQRIENIICKEHGAFSQYPSQLRNEGATCPSCGHEERGRTKRTPSEVYFAKVALVHGNRYDYKETVFTGMNTSITVKCPDHGDFTIDANHHYYRKQGCGKCEVDNKAIRILKYRHLSSSAKIANTAVDFFSRCTEAHDGTYTYPPQEYKGAKEKIRIICDKHGEFTQAAWAHLSGKGCASCGAYSAKWETDLTKYIMGQGHEVINNAAVLNGKEIDVYVPSIKFGVELHGLRWHTDNKRGASYHRDKWMSAQAAGIKLLQVFEDEWVDKQHIVKARIEAMLGNGQKFHARKCIVKTIEFNEAKKFLEKTHIQGCGVASIYYGLYYKDSLVAVASFGKSRSGAMTGAMEDGVWEVIRYASIGRVRGGFSKVYRQFIQLVNPVKVISYCDLRYGDGKVYAATGFKLDSITPPDYWWVPSGKIQRIPRYTTQKHKLATHPVLSKFYSPEKTENQICAEAGWEKIHGVGNQKWVWTPSTA